MQLPHSSQRQLVDGRENATRLDKVRRSAAKSRSCPSRAPTLRREVDEIVGPRLRRSSSEQANREHDHEYTKAPHPDVR
jgi:hypothetical protein